MTTRAISLFFAVASAAAYAFTHVESAACYASRYPELHERFCLNDICDTRALHDHFKNEGRTKKWRWGCTNTTSSYRSPATTGVCLSLATGNDPAKNRERPDPSEEQKCLLRTEPSPYVDVIYKTVLGLPRFGRCNTKNGCTTVLPYDAKQRAYGDDWPPTGLTMIGNERLDQFRAAVEEVNRNNIPGAVVEMGVWRGGAMLVAAACQK